MVSAPELKAYMNKHLLVQMNGSRKVTGILKGYDVFLNITLTEALEQKLDGDKLSLGTVVIRGNSVVSMEYIGSANAADLLRFHSLKTTNVQALEKI